MPQTFKDRAQRTWSIEITVASLKRVREGAGVDLGKLLEADFAPLQKFLRDPEKVINVLFVLCRDEAAKLGITDEQFGESFSGESLAAAADAFLEAYLDFLSDRRAAEALRKMFKLSREANLLALRDADAEMSAMTPEKMVKDAKARISKAKSGDWPASSESPIPAT